MIVIIHGFITIEKVIKNAITVKKKKKYSKNKMINSKILTLILFDYSNHPSSASYNESIAEIEQEYVNKNFKVMQETANKLGYPMFQCITDLRMHMNQRNIFVYDTITGNKLFDIKDIIL